MVASLFAVHCLDIINHIKGGGVSMSITLSYPETRKRVISNTADPDQTPHHVASDQRIQCLLTGFSIKNRIKATK